MLERFFAERAGNTGTLNTANYVNCEYTVAGHRQAVTTDEEERGEHVLEAQRILSEDAVINPVSPVLNVAAVRSDEIEIGGVGDAGILHHNPHFYIQSSPKNGDSYTVDTSPVTLESTHYQVLDSTPSLSFWNHLVSSTLVEYDENLELQNMLAEDITLENDGTRVVVTLRDDAQFQNGDPVTAEDVQFTFQYLWERPEQFPQLEVPPYESIEVEDELTTVFTFSEPYAPLLNRNWATWGILHKESWVEMGALEQSSVEPGTDLIGSGPFELTDFTSGDAMTLSPVDTHPVHKPDHSINVQVFRDLPPKVQAFRTNDIQVMINVPFSVYQEINNDMADTATTEVAEGTLCWGVFHNYPVAPSKFRPYRRAVGQSLDRALINETAFYGESYEPLQSTVYMRNHPYQPPEGEVYTFNDPTGDMEAARSILEDAGWSWDDNGNLRYPEGANLEPIWPQAETPDPADYPCLDSEGNFQYPG
jgi:peptide/nickel transport system substrate-binding protein